MGLLQRTIVGLFPERLAAAMEAESKEWILRCKAGHERSVWAAGGVRFKASREKWVLARCDECGKLRWLRLFRRRAARGAGETKGTAG